MIAKWSTPLLVVLVLLTAPFAAGQTPITSTWDGTSATWSDTGNWDLLGGSDFYPDNSGSYVYDVILPSSGGMSYAIYVDVPTIELDSLSIDADADLLLGSTDFSPGALVNAGWIELQTDDLYLLESVTNTGTIAFDTDTSAEYIYVNDAITLDGTGALQFTDIGTTSSSVHRVTIGTSGTLTNGVDHTIEGGPGEIYYSGSNRKSLINNGVIRANTPGKRLELDGYSDRMEIENNNLLTATNGGILYLKDIWELTNDAGVLSCDADSEITIYDTSTEVRGTINCDGVIRLANGSYVRLITTTGSGTGTYLQESGYTYFETGATVAFGTVNILAGTFTVSTSALVTVENLFTHALTNEASLVFDPTTSLRITGGTTAGPTDYDDFAALEIAGLDMGDVVEGFSDNFDLPNLVIGPGAKVNLFDVINNGNRDGSAGVAEALYVDTITFEDANGVLNTNGHHLYYNTLVGNAGQIVDSGGGSGKLVTTSWTCGTDNWSATACWDVLASGDTYPTNDPTTAYAVTLPAGGSPYFVTADVGPVTVGTLDIDADTTVTLAADDFDPGLLTNSGTIQLDANELYLNQAITNDGTIRFDLDTSAEYIYINSHVLLDGTGVLRFPDIATTSSSVHRINIAADRTLTNGPDHVIEGGPGEIYYASGHHQALVNEGVIRANTPGKALELDGSSDRLGIDNNNLIEAVDGGTLRLYNVWELVNSGTLSCDADSEIHIQDTSTDLTGTVNCDGLIRLLNGSYVYLDNTSGNGSGELRLESGGLTYETGTTVSFGTLNILTGFITAQAGALVTVKDHYTHALTTPTSHTFDPASALRITGGTTAGPTTCADFAAIEIACEDLGTDPVLHTGDPAGFVDNFSLPKLIIGPAAKVNLQDLINNGHRDGVGGVSEALYVDTLEFEDASGVLNLNGYHLYYNTLIGDPLQIVDLTNCGEATVATWTCLTDDWTSTACWDVLAPGDSYPNNVLLGVYDVSLPAMGGTYSVDANVGPVTVRSLEVDADATLVLTSNDFDPGALTNNGVMQLESDELYLKQSLTNNGTIRYDNDTGAEYIKINSDLTFGGTGTLRFPDIGTTSTSTQRIDIAANHTLTNGPDHTIEGGCGEIYYSSTHRMAFVNDGVLRANVPGKTFELDGSSDRLGIENNNLIEAVGGGTLRMYNVWELTNNGTLSCDADSEVHILDSSTDLAGTVNIDGLLRLANGAYLNWDGTTGSGSGEYRQESGGTTVRFGSVVEFGTVDIQTGGLTIESGGLVTVSKLFTHNLTSETSHTMAATGGLRVTGGVGLSLCDVDNITHIEVAGSDMGTDPATFTGDPAGFINNFHLPRLIVGAGARAMLVDDVNNGNRNGAFGADEALYVDTLEFEDAAGGLYLNGLHLYYNTLIGDASQVVVSFDADCNANMIPDACEIADGLVDDINHNDIPDECEDCNTNMIPDPLDILAGTSDDCDGDGLPDECEVGFDAFVWAGPDGGAFVEPAHWSPAGPPAGEVSLTNTSADDNTAVVGDAGTTQVCALAISAAGAGDQVVDISAGSVLDVTGGGTIGDGGVVAMSGGTLSGGAFSVTDGQLIGHGEVDASVASSGVITGAPGETLTFSGDAFENQLGGSVDVPAAAIVVVQSATVAQAGAVDVGTLGGIVMSASLTNAPTGAISLMGGSLSAAGVTNEAGGTIDGFGTIDGSTTNDGGMTLVADTQIVGDLHNDGTVTIQGGTLTVTGSLTGSGTVYGDISGVAGVRGDDGMTVIGDCGIAATGSLTMGTGTLAVGGAFDIAINDTARFDLTTSTLQLVGLPDDAPQQLEMLADNGGDVVPMPNPDLFSIGTLRVGPPCTTVQLVDHHDNTTGGGAEVLYVGALVLDRCTTLDLAGQTIYYGSVSPEDPYADPNVTIIDTVGGGALIAIGIPLSCTTDSECVLASNNACDWNRCGSATPGYCDPAIQAMFGDVCGADFAIEPNGAVNLTDVLCTLNGFGLGNFDNCPNADVAGVDPGDCPATNGIINLTDILKVLDAFGAPSSPSAIFFCDCPANP